jgi:hypothetical protein
MLVGDPLVTHPLVMLIFPVPVRFGLDRGKERSNVTMVQQPASWWRPN